MHVILMGAQGAGKGTQAERIAPHYKLAHLSTGELFRSEIASESELGRRLKEILDQGELVPDDLTISIVDAKLKEISLGPDSREGALFDGFPRTAAQAEGLDKVLARRGEMIDSVVEVFVPREKLIERLSGRRICPTCGATFHLEFNPPNVEGICDRCESKLIQRPDDTADAINRRLDIYFSQTEPLLEYYRSRGVLKRVDGDQPINEVTQAIFEAIESSKPASRA